MKQLMMICLVVVFMLAVPTNVSAATITVPNDYPTIQGGINAANTGDTVFVRSGTYYEHVTIGKSLTLQGEDRNTTIIDAGGVGDVIYLTGSNVNFSEFTVHNGEVGIRLRNSNRNTIGNSIISDADAGIVMHNSKHNLIVDCNLTNLTSGINLWAGSDYNTYENCTASDCSFVGFHVGWGRYNVVKNCKAFNCTYGIELDSCQYATVENCDVWSNNVGILIHNWGSTMYNTITQCNIYSNNTGILAYDARGRGGYNKIYHNDFIDNTVHQATDTQYYPNAWDDGYPSGGNYWSDYTGVDNYSGVNQDQPGSDGIGDTPYIIDADTRDNYPLVRDIDIDIDIDPDTLNTKSKGKWVTVYITLPEEYDVCDIDISTVEITSLAGESCGPEYTQPADLSFVPQVGDRDEDGIDDLTVKFDRQELIANLCLDDVSITIEGELTTGEHFAGTDTIRVIQRGK